jgi:long-chain acyl-CoA synthetase
MLTAHACFINSITVVTVYTNLGDEALLYALNEGEIKYLLTSGRNVTKLLQLLGDDGEHCPTLEYILFTDTLQQNLKSTKKHKLVSLSDVEKGESQYMMKADQAPPECEPTPDSLAVIMYTSGSTGNPKGVILTHRQLAGAVAGFRSVIELHDNDVYLAYLPLAHVLELVAEISMLVLGVCVGYGRPRTLIDNPLSVRPCGDISSLRPTVMAGVPTVFDRIMKGAHGKIKESHPVIQWLFGRAFATKAAALKHGGTSLVWDLVFGRTLRKLIGGRVRRILSGGAPLSEKTDEFMRAAFSIPVSQGYGLTETCGCGTVMMENDPAYRVVGPPVPSVEIRLVDVPDMKYLSTDTKGSHGEKVLGRGEVWFRGVNVASVCHCCLNVLAYYQSDLRVLTNLYLYLVVVVVVVVAVVVVVVAMPCLIL